MKVAEGLASPAIDKLKQVASKVGDFFTGLWADYGAPAWEWLKKTAGRAWEAITRLRLAAVGLDQARPRPDRLGVALAAAEDRDRASRRRRPGRPARVAQAQGRRGVGRRSRPSSSPTRSSSRSSPGSSCCSRPPARSSSIAAAAAGLIKAAQWLAKTLLQARRDRLRAAHAAAGDRAADQARHRRGHQGASQAAPPGSSRSSPRVVKGLQGAARRARRLAAALPRDRRQLAARALPGARRRGRRRRSTASRTWSAAG